MEKGGTGNGPRGRKENHWRSEKKAKARTDIKKASVLKGSPSAMLWDTKESVAREKKKQVGGGRKERGEGATALDRPKRCPES